MMRPARRASIRRIRCLVQRAADPPWEPTARGRRASRPPTTPPITPPVFVTSGAATYNLFSDQD